tara:strand:- start:602567 stop:603535 length:969 start_codon:yes stop_codon:yes gene_type:complete
MITYILVFISLVILAFIYLKLADHFNIIDKPNQRSSHIEPTIRGGGILFFLGLLLFFFSSNFTYPYFILGVSIIAIVSFVDDLITLGRRIRLLFHFITAFLLLVQLTLLGLPIWALLICLIFAVAFFNLFNFMDGINGLTGLYTLAVLSVFLAINYNEHIVDQDLLIYSAIAIVVFGYFNFRKKAKWFAGDIGSMTLATLLLFLGGKFAVALEAPIFLLVVLVYAIDGGLTILVRFMLKENITVAHRHHIYQKLVDVEKWSHIKVAVVYAFIQSLINVLVYFTYTFAFKVQILIVIATILVMSGVYYLLKNRYDKIAKSIES